MKRQVHAFRLNITVVDNSITLYDKFDKLLLRATSDGIEIMYVNLPQPIRTLYQYTNQPAAIHLLQQNIQSLLSPELTDPTQFAELAKETMLTLLSEFTEAKEQLISDLAELTIEPATFNHANEYLKSLLSQSDPITLHKEITPEELLKCIEPNDLIIIYEDYALVPERIISLNPLDKSAVLAYCSGLLKSKEQVKVPLKALSNYLLNPPQVLLPLVPQGYRPDLPVFSVKFNELDKPGQSEISKIKSLINENQIREAIVEAAAAYSLLHPHTDLERHILLKQLQIDNEPSIYFPAHPMISILSQSNPIVFFKTPPIIKRKDINWVVYFNGLGPFSAIITWNDETWYNTISNLKKPYQYVPYITSVIPAIDGSYPEFLSEFIKSSYYFVYPFNVERYSYSGNTGLTEKQPDIGMFLLVTKLYNLIYQTTFDPIAETLRVLELANLNATIRELFPIITIPKISSYTEITPFLIGEIPYSIQLDELELFNFNSYLLKLHLNSEKPTLLQNLYQDAVFRFHRSFFLFMSDYFYDLYKQSKKSLYKQLHSIFGNYATTLREKGIQAIKQIYDPDD